MMILNIYYSIDDTGKLSLDEDNLNEDFRLKLEEIKKVFDNQDKE